MRHLKTGFVVAIAMAAALGACGRSDVVGSGEASAASITAGRATGTVEMWAQGAEAEALPALLADFEKANPDVKVNVTAVPWGEAHDKYQTAIAAGITPDIGQMGTTWMGEFAATDAFDATPSAIDMTSFYGGSTESTAVAGGTYGVPWYVDTPVLYYRTDLAAQAGFTGPPTTWIELQAMAAAMQAKAGATWGLGLGTHDYQGFMPFAWSNGASLTSSDGSAWTLNTPEMVEAVSYYQSYFTKGISNPAPSADPGASEAAFVNGSVPMLFGGPFEVTALNQAGGEGFADKFATAPWPKEASSTSFVGGSDLVVFKESKNRDAAWKVIQYLATPQVQAKWYGVTGDLPSVEAAWSLPALAGDPKLAVFGEQLTSVVSPPQATTWAEVVSAADGLMEQISVSGLDPADAMSELQATADSIGMGR